MPGDLSTSRYLPAPWGGLGGQTRPVLASPQLRLLLISRMDAPHLLFLSVLINSYYVVLGAGESAGSELTDSPAFMAGDRQWRRRTDLACNRGGRKWKRGQAGMNVLF